MNVVAFSKNIPKTVDEIIYVTQIPWYPEERLLGEAEN